MKRSNDPLGAAIAMAGDVPVPYRREVNRAIQSGQLCVDDMPYVIASLLAQLDNT